MDARVWTIPANRMKGAQIAEATKAARGAEGAKPEFVFAGATPGRPPSNMAMLAVLRRMRRTDIVPHGFRSTFRDWCAERPN